MIEAIIVISYLGKSCESRYFPSPNINPLNVSGCYICRKFFVRFVMFFLLLQLVEYIWEIVTVAVSVFYYIHIWL